MRKGVTIWEPSNVYDSAILGEGVSVGAFAEIGPNVKIGDRTGSEKGVSYRRE